MEAQNDVIHPGTIVVAGTLGAMFDPDMVESPYPDPEVFHPSRPDRSYLFFGFGPHACLGRYSSQLPIPLLIRHVVAQGKLTRRRERNGGDRFNPVDLLPEHLFLEFEPE